MDDPITEDVANTARTYLSHMFKIMAKDTETCFCGQHIEKLVQDGRCVYAEPCGCRIYQGTVPKAWKE